MRARLPTSPRMRHWRGRLVPMLVVGLGLAAVPAVVELVWGERLVYFTGTLHFYAVGVSALVAAAAAVGLTVIGARRGDTRTMLVGTAFAVMASLLALHGFSTPGVIFGSNSVVEITGGATLPVGALILSASALPLPKTMANVVPMLLLEAGLLAVVIALGASALAWPKLFPAVPAANSPSALVLLVVGLGAFGLLATRAFRT